MTTHQQKFYEQIGFEQNSSTTLVLCNGDSDQQITTSDLTQATVFQ
jgi:hypothetical protein